MNDYTVEEVYNNINDESYIKDVVERANSTIFKNKNLFENNSKISNNHTHYDNINELTLTIDMFDVPIIKAYVYDKSHPENELKWWSYYAYNKFMYTYRLMPNYDKNNKTYDITKCYYNDLITSNFNNTPYSYEVWCAVMLEYIINDIQDSYSSMSNKYNENRPYIHLSEYKIKTITFIVNDTFNFRTLDMISKLLFNKYIFKYITRSSTFNNALLMNNIQQDKVCLVTLTDNTTEISHLNYDNINYTYNHVNTKKTDGVIDLYKKLLKLLPDYVKLEDLDDLIFKLYNDNKTVILDHLKKLCVDNSDDDDDDEVNKYCDKQVKNIQIEQLIDIVNNYINTVISLIDDNEYVIYFNILDSDNLGNILKTNVKNHFNVSEVLNNDYFLQYNINEFIIYYTASHPNNTEMVDSSMLNLLKNYEFDEFKKIIKRVNLYPNFKDSMHIPYVKHKECALSKNLLDLYTLKTNINSVPILKEIGTIMHKHVNEIFNIEPIQRKQVSLNDKNNKPIKGLHYIYEYDMTDNGQEFYNGHNCISLNLNKIANMINNIPNYNNINELLKRYIYNFY